MKKIRSILRIISAHLIPKIAYPVIRGPLFGLKFIHGAASGEGGGATIFFGLVEPKQTEAFKSALKDGFIVFDVGANIGYYTLLGFSNNREKWENFCIRTINKKYWNIWLNKYASIKLQTQ
jgi:hypothetical protein